MKYKTQTHRCVVILTTAAADYVNKRLSAYHRDTIRAHQTLILDTTATLLYAACCKGGTAPVEPCCKPAIQHALPATDHDIQHTRPSVTTCAATVTDCSAIFTQRRNGLDFSKKRVQIL